MSSDNVIKFGKARKKIARKRKEAQAAENRITFGRTKSEKEADAKRKSKFKSQVDRHKRDKDND